jgi:hypothetical protein
MADPGRIAAHLWHLAARFGRDQRGVVAVVTAFGMIGMVGMIGIVVDTAVILEERRQLQNAVDAAALAASMAERASPGTGIDAAYEYLELNGVDPDDPAVDIVIDSGYATDQVEVTVRADVPTAFFALFGVPSKSIGVRAVGLAEPAVDVGDYAFVALNETACRAFDTAGSASLVVNGGGVFVNSDCPANATWVHGALDIEVHTFKHFNEGGVLVQGSASVTPDPTGVTSRIDDPLTGLPVPSVATSPDSGGTQSHPDERKVTHAVTLEPGVYWGGLDIRADVTLEPGIYVMAGGGIRTSGGGSVEGHGVLIYNADNPGEEDCGAIVLTGGNDLAITPMDSGDYEGVSFWQDEDCDEAFTLRGGHDSLTGLIYAPGATFDFAGGGQLGSIQVIADQVVLRGSSAVTMDFHGYVSGGASGDVRLAE